MWIQLKKDEARREICFKKLPAVGPEVGALVPSSELEAGALVPSSELEAGALVPSSELEAGALVPSSELDAGASVCAEVGPVLNVKNLVDYVEMFLFILIKN